jgi:CubicO group peptidase (beta-lactamase class C family)
LKFPTSHESAGGINSGVAGTRRAGKDIPVRIDDRFHLGSDSEAFTSLLAALFVEEGKPVDAPLGHVIEEGKPKAILAGPNGDNPLILGPAGTMHMSVLDFAKWVAWQAGEGRRPPALVSPDTVKRLHTPVIDTGVRENAPPGTPKTGGYALGWGQVTEDWAPEPAVTHTGSNTMNLALAMFWPETDFGFVIVTNSAGTRADEALRKLAVTLCQEFSAK